MKRILTAMLGLLLSFVAFPQAPSGFNYQAVLRNSSGQVIASQSATLRISLTDEAGTTTLYSETHGVTTTAQGLINVVVGNGQNKIGTISAVPWGEQPIFIKVEYMPSGSGIYTQMGSQQIQSAPYALYAADGVTIKWQGALPNAPSSPGKNYAYYNTFDKISYIWDGDSWEILAMDGLQGPKGDTGIQGPQGLTGSAGPIGPTGPRGPAGVGLTLKGNWSKDSAYVAGNYVFDESSGTVGVNSMWICQTAVGPTLNRPKSDLTNWVEFEAPEGPQGIQGPVGPQGPAGNQGPVGMDGISVIWLGTFASNPANPALNNAYYNSALKKSFVWDGNSWEIMAQDGVKGDTGPLVVGTNGQMLVHNGTTWAASNAITVKSDTVAIGVGYPISKLIVQGDFTALPEDPIFEVKNKDGQVVFGVYNEGVRVYISDVAKGAKGGFAVGGLSGSKVSSEYLRITPDSARIYINDLAKGTKGGFAVGGLSGTKSASEYLRITPDSARIYVKDQAKGAKGGFAVGG